MTAKMEEGFRNEQQAENSRQMQTDLQAIKEKIRQLESGSGSGSTVSSEVSTAVGKGPSGTFARPPLGIAFRLNDMFMPRRMEFNGWVTDYKLRSYQGLTETEVSNFINDLHQMVPDALKKYVDWEQTRTEQGTWPTKIMVSFWFSNEANLPTRIGVLDVIRAELQKGPQKQKGQVVSSRLELSPKRKPRTRGGQRGQVQDSRASLWRAQ